MSDGHIVGLLLIYLHPTHNPVVSDNLRSQQLSRKCPLGRRKVLTMIRRILAMSAASLIFAPYLLSQKPDTSLKQKAALSLPNSVVSPEWDGTWGLNPSRSSGPFVTISISADGEYRYDNGVSSFTFRCDGKDQPIGKDRTQACVKASATTLDLTRKENGTKTIAYHWELSADGKVLTATTTTFRPSGPVTTKNVVASRVSGSNGFAGQWRDTIYLQRHAEMTLSFDSRTLHLSYPSAGQYVDVPLSGADAPVQGPHAPEGATYSIRLAGRREIHTLMKRNGKALTQGSLELSDDGKVITHTWWKSDQPADKMKFVYERKS